MKAAHRRQGIAERPAGERCAFASRDRTGLAGFFFDSGRAAWRLICMRSITAALGGIWALCAALPFSTAAQAVAFSYYHPFRGSGGTGISLGGSTPIGASPVAVDFQLSYHWEMRT
jgi:hypothetical protein